MSKEEAFKNTVECITGPITKIISTKGIDAVYKSLNDADKKIFMEAYQVRQPPPDPLRLHRGPTLQSPSRGFPGVQCHCARSTHRANRRRNSVQRAYGTLLRMCLRRVSRRLTSMARAPSPSPPFGWLRGGSELTCADLSGPGPDSGTRRPTFPPRTS